ncbi:hypothetical protein A2U01_0011785 [Trifolium medium]|uniref:Putative plant transposon protein domain-containing protein n=1 Tax=Trifolium medium TaxID=97028 RepID=A0A392MUA8_9FABA|nr:hypothetical protein [Trifolium medium]
MVRGRQIRFDRDALNAYLGNPLHLPPHTICAYSEVLAKKNWPIENIAKHLFIEGRSFDCNARGHVIRVTRDNLAVPAQVILLLIVYNLKPKSHTSTATMDRVTLLWYILVGLQVDIARVISNEMKRIAESGIKNDSKPIISYPGLIMGLCSDARAVLPAYVSETIDGPINDTYIERHCKNKKV